MPLSDAAISAVCRVPAAEATGLSSAEVEERVRAGQVNRAPPPPGRSIREILRANVLTRFNAILGSLLVVVAFIGPIQDALFGVVVVINTTIGISQELRAKRSLDRLAILTAPKAHAVRDGVVTDIPIGEVVLDDVIELRPGDQIAVDGDVISSDGLEVDESLLTGETEPIAKTANDRVLSGSFVVAGVASIRATGVGAASYASGLESQARSFSLIRSELQQGTNQILRLVTWVMIPTGVVLVLTQLLHRHNESVADALRGSVAGVSAMVPEGLVLLTSIAFAVGALRLARQRVLVQELAAVEGLARVDVLCIDKTGTLTAPGMTLESIACLSDQSLETVREVLAAIAAADPAPNATMRAVIDDSGPAPSWDVAARVPFSSSRKWSAVTFVDRGTWVLGAPDVVAPKALDRMLSPKGIRASSAQRVVLLARCDAVIEGTDLPRPLNPIALLMFSEQLRADAEATVRYLATQGVGIVVLSGDAPKTVAIVARRAGVPTFGAPQDASDFDDAELANALTTANVFGRVRPEQKLSAVRAVQAEGHVVAMVGDGVNDVQALKQADLGIAMGSGSESSRSVARVVLLDSAFSAVPQMLAEGRKVIANIERVANLFITKTVYASLLAVAVAVTAVSYPFFPRHLTVITTFTIGIPAFFLALAPGAPRARSGFTRRVLTFSIPVGITAAAATFTSYFIARVVSTDTLTQARTAAMFALFAVGMWALVLVAMPLNRWRAFLVAAMSVGVIVPFVSPVLRRTFAIQLPSVPVLLATAGTVVIAIGALTIWRRIAARSGLLKSAAPS